MVTRTSDAILSPAPHSDTDGDGLAGCFRMGADRFGQIRRIHLLYRYTRVRTRAHIPVYLGHSSNPSGPVRSPRAAPMPVRKHKRPRAAPAPQPPAPPHKLNERTT
jgi:hypothetical protein